MGNMFEPIDTTSNCTVADIKIKNTSMNTPVAVMTYVIKQPDEYAKDFIVGLRASEIRKVRKCCEEAKKNKFPWCEILLAISTSCVGCSLGAFASSVALNSLKGVFMYIISLIIATGTFVAYLFMRKTSVTDVNDLAEKVKEYIINPDDMEGENRG